MKIHPVFGKAVSLPTSRLSGLLLDGREGREMSPLFMDTGYEPNSPGSLSAEDCNSNTAGSEREGEGQQVENTGKKRRDKNRDAARRTRRKQTERADELHEELQRLERSNSALQKEIAALKKDLNHYTTALAHHEPYCRLKASGSSSSAATQIPVSPSTKCHTSSSPPRVTPQASSSTLAAAPSISTSLTSGLGLQTFDCVENPHLSPPASAAAATTLASISGSSAELVIASASSSSSPVTVPYSASFSTLEAPHSLFSEELPITSKPASVTPVCSSLSTAAQPHSGHNTIHETSSMPANACFSALNSETLDAFLMKQTSFLTAPSDMVAPYSHLMGEHEGLMAHSCSMNSAQLHPGQFSGNPNNSSQQCALLPSTPQAPALRSLTVTSQANLERPPASAFKPCYRQQMTPSPTHASLLSLLTTPCPLNISQTTSTNSSDGAVFQPPPPSLPLSGDPTSDLSLSDFLEINDWILSGNNNQ
ncbi:uncharacterized protein batf2 [Lates calcarifer]|uniref:Uncharacterized protein batf2 n=1 Tax=Lates calcarifer TaxID=8187 RepID=A0AAJ7PWM1_LATCA|nr:uncharacterized protein batf2 [Lates calcarifer]